MKTSVAVQAFKSITSRIHPQLPLSPKESQRLLNALTSSFNHHLDQELAGPNSTSPRHSQRESAPPLQQTPLASASSRNTDIHLASILTNPLFGRPAQGPAPSNAALSQLKTKSKHPVRVFEDAVARGQATIDIARLCLNAFRTSLNALPSPDRNTHIRNLAAGTRVLRWLWSSGKIHALSFSEDRRFLDVLSYFLVVEANESSLWDLIETDARQVTSKEPHVPATELRRRRGLILCSLVKAHLSVEEASPHAATAAALSAFLRAADSQQASPSTPPSISLAAAGAFLSRKLAAIDVATHSHPAPAVLYDRFVESCPVWDKSPSDRALYRVAALRLHHPVSPSARDALFFIRHLKQSPKHPFLTPSTDSQRNDVFKFLFDTVHLLQAQAFRDDAAWVMEFMQKSFPHHFVDQDTQLKPANAPIAQPDIASTHSVTRVHHVSEPSLNTWRLPDVG